MERSGGMYGFTRDVAKYATTSRTGQFCAFLVGVFVFFDDYANVLLAGETMRPLLDSLFVSREKLAFVVDATAAPIASISPVSSWVGFEIGLIQTEIDKLAEKYGEDSLFIETSGMGVFLQSIKYRYVSVSMFAIEDDTLLLNSQHLYFVPRLFTVPYFHAHLDGHVDC